MSGAHLPNMSQVTPERDPGAEDETVELGPFLSEEEHRARRRRSEIGLTLGMKWVIVIASVLIAFAVVGTVSAILNPSAMRQCLQSGGSFHQDSKGVTCSVR